tara:strand:+ start:328 stop:1221 length:894 start_codon:yes stop_codon:yes gene_type:complete
METHNTNIKGRANYNLAGIIPTAGQALDFNMPWHDSLMPIGQNYLAVEKAVLDCAIAGCDTIWIVCPKEMQPLIRYRLGDWVMDPIKYFTGVTFAKYPTQYEIPIYYCPLEPKDVGRRDCLSWSIITGAQYAWRVGAKISRYTIPDKYFVTFPYGMFSPYYMKDWRTKIRSNDTCFLSCEDKSFMDGEYLPFTFFPEEFLEVRKKFRKNETKGHDAEGNKLSAKERYSGRYFTHDFVFGDIGSEKKHNINVPWYYNISSWEGLRNWFRSDNKLDRPKDLILSYNEWNPLGGEVDEQQ